VLDKDAIQVLGSTGNLPVPVGNLPTGTTKARLPPKLGSHKRSSPLPSARQVAGRNGQVARSTRLPKPDLRPFDKL